VSSFIYKEIDGIIYASLNPRYKNLIAQKKYEFLLKESGVPEFYWDIHFENYRGTRSIDSVEKLKKFSLDLDNPKFNHVHFYLFGINSSQKTSMGCCVLKEAMRKGKTCKFVLAGDLIDKLLKSQGFSVSEDIENYIRNLREADIILIDDAFDPSKSLMWSRPESANLVITAWDIFLRSMITSSTKIIMTSNVPIENIKEKFGESMFHLIDRNFVQLPFYDSYKELRKKKFDNLFD
jgi:DNA replication protein DnaC